MSVLEAEARAVNWESASPPSAWSRLGAVVSPGRLGSTVTASTPKESRPSVCALEARLWTILSGGLASQKVGSRGQAQPEGGHEDTSARLSPRGHLCDEQRQLRKTGWGLWGGRGLWAWVGLKLDDLLSSAKSHVLKFQILPECPISCEPTLLDIGRFLKDSSFPNHKYDLFTILKKKKYWEKVLLIGIVSIEVYIIRNSRWQDLKILIHLKQWEQTHLILA